MVNSLKINKHQLNSMIVLSDG